MSDFHQKPNQLCEAPLAEVDSILTGLLPAFLKNRRTNLNELQEAFIKRDYLKIQKIGHILKGISGSYGFSIMGIYGSQIEEAASHEDLSGIQREISSIKDYLNKVQIKFI